MPSETKPNRDLGVIAKEIRVEEKKNIKSLAKSPENCSRKPPISASTGNT